MLMSIPLTRQAECARRDDHALDLRRAAGVVGERLAVGALYLARERCPFAVLHLAERADDVHASLRELGHELLDDRLVHVLAVRAPSFVREQLPDLHADR